jgi:predicted dienelactone hydrolase
MKLANFFSKLILLTLLSSCSKEVTVQSGDVAVGIQRVSYFDTDRSSWQNDGSRPLKTTIWYPANDNTKMTEMLIPSDKPVFSGGWAARDAPIKESLKQYPLIIMSHGTGGSAFQLMWLGRRLAAAGYIAAAVDHHGNTAAEEAFDARGFRLFWERADDLSVLIDHLLADKKFGSAIDVDKIGSVGFSLGGYSVIAVSGGIIDLEQLEVFCSGPKRDTTCDPQTEYADNERDFQQFKDTPQVVNSLARHAHPFLDTRIKATAALAPALGMAFTKESLSSIEIPVHIVVGESDTIAPSATNAKIIADSIGGAKLTVLKGGPGHYTFLNQCTSRGLRYVPICADTEGVDRAAIHAQTSELVLHHFNSAFSQ